MGKNNIVLLTEMYVKNTTGKSTLTIAHDYNHVDRVRKWAVLIGSEEGYSDVELIEVTALLHDIGLNYIDEFVDRRTHGEAGAEMAAQFLQKESGYSSSQINEIAAAIKYHSLAPDVVAEYLKSSEKDEILIKILRDADNLDAFGAMGLMRAFVSKNNLEEYDPDNIKGDTWGLSTQEFDAKYPDRFNSEKYVIGQINQQIRLYDILHTITARKLARPLVKYMQDFVLQLEREVNNELSIDYGKKG
jgi:uncharacterized protein